MEKVTITELSAEEFYQRFEELENKFDTIESQKNQTPHQLILLTPKEVCKLLKISPSTLHNYVNKGVLNKYAMPGSGKVLFRLDEIENSLEQFKI